MKKSAFILFFMNFYVKQGNWNHWGCRLYVLKLFFAGELRSAWILDSWAWHKKQPGLVWISKVKATFGKKRVFWQFEFFRKRTNQSLQVTTGKNKAASHSTAERTTKNHNISQTDDNPAIWGKATKYVVFKGFCDTISITIS